MSKVWRQTFRVWREDRERDERYQRLMQALGAFVDLPTLMGVAGVQPDAALLAMAQVRECGGGGRGAGGTDKHTNTTLISAAVAVAAAPDCRRSLPAHCPHTCTLHACPLHRRSC